MRRYSLSPELEVSSVAYGVWRLADDPEGYAPERVRSKIDACLEVGITTFDHADIYGLYICEGIFGAVLADAPELRDQMEIVTKCGIRYPCDALPDVGVKHYDATADAIESCVDRSLTELRTDRIDVLLIHRPDWLTRADDTASGLQRVIDAGKVRAVGVSNYSTDQVDLLARYLGETPVTNQVEVSLLHSDAIYDGTLNQCETHGRHPMAWSPLAGGRLLGSGDPDAVRAREELEAVAQEVGASIDQVALAWVAALPSRPIVVIGTNKPDRIRTAAASDDITLSREQWYRLWAAAHGREVP